MKRLIAAAILAVFAATASAGGAHTNPKPQPKPQPEAPKSNDSDAIVPILFLAAALAGVVIYHQKREKDEKKVAVQPTPDGKGLQAAVEYRF